MRFKDSLKKMASQTALIIPPQQFFVGLTRVQLKPCQLWEWVDMVLSLHSQQSELVGMLP